MIVFENKFFPPTIACSCLVRSKLEYSSTLWPLMPCREATLFPSLFIQAFPLFSTPIYVFCLIKSHSNWWKNSPINSWSLDKLMNRNYDFVWRYLPHWSLDWLFSVVCFLIVGVLPALNHVWEVAIFHSNSSPGSYILISCLEPLVYIPKCS